MLDKRADWSNPSGDGNAGQRMAALLVKWEGIKEIYIHPDR